MTNPVLISIPLTELRSIVRDAVTEALSEINIPLTPKQACKVLGVSFNTYKRMLYFTGREHIKQSEINQLKTEYHERKKELRSFVKKS